MSIARETKTKRCSRCRRTLPREAFNRNRAQRDGIDTYCRACKSAYQREYRVRRPPKSYEYEPAERWLIEDRIASIAARNRADGFPCAFEE